MMPKKSAPTSDGEPDVCPACQSDRASRVRTHAKPIVVRCADLPKGMVPLETYDVRCWTCGEESTITRYVPARLLTIPSS